MKRYRLDALFLTQIYIGFKFCPFVLEIVGLGIPARYMRDIALFSVCSSTKNCPSARRASAADVVCKDVDVFGGRKVLNHIYRILELFIYIIIIMSINEFTYEYYFFSPL
jgi:hypothetical protein